MQTCQLLLHALTRNTPFVICNLCSSCGTWHRRRVMRIEARRAQDVVSGEKTLELTGKACHQRGLILIGETAKGSARSPCCVIGAVTLGECDRISSHEAFEETADRHRALDFAPAREWLEAGTLHAQELKSAVRFEQAVPYKHVKGARKWLDYRAVHPSAVEAKLARIVKQACSVARGQAWVLRELIRLLDGEASTLEETAESEEDEPRRRGRVLDDDDAMEGVASGDEAGGEAGGEGGSSIDGDEAEGGDERGEEADDESADERDEEGSRPAPPSGGGALPEDESTELSPIPGLPIVVVDMRTWGALLPKALYDSFGPVVELCQATPDACRLTDNTVKHAMDARDNQSSRIGRAGAELSVPPDQLLLATLPDGRGGVCGAMWAVVESVERDRHRGPHRKISIVRLVVTPEHRRGDPQLERRNVKLDLLLAIVDAGLREPCDRVALTLADADCITNKRGSMWRRLFKAVVDLRPHVGVDAEGLDEAPKGERWRVAALPCLWASPTGAPPPTREPKHPADEFCERAEGALAAKGAHADATINPLTGERNALVHPYSQEEKAAMRAADGEADSSGEEMEEVDEEGEAEAEEGSEGGSASGAAPPSLIDVVVPEGCFPGMEFAVSVEGATFNVTVPDGVSPGDMITVEEPAGSATPPPSAAAHASSYPDVLAEDQEAFHEQMLREEALREQEEADAAIAHFERAQEWGEAPERDLVAAAEDGEGGEVATAAAAEGSGGDEPPGGGEGSGGETGGGDEGGVTEPLADTNREALSRHNKMIKAEHAQLVYVRPLAALERLCKANGLVTSGKKYELLTRLVNAEKHGRAKPCPRCKANLHLVCTPSELQPNEVTQLVCRHWNYRGGKREPCGYKVDITPQNKAAQLCLRLVDSPERDLAAAAELAKAVEHAEGDEGGEGGELAVAEKPWAPKDTEELLHAIATKDYGVSQDRSSKLAVPAIKAYNAVADRYHQTLQKRGQPLHEGFTIVKVRSAVTLHGTPHPLPYMAMRYMTIRVAFFGNPIGSAPWSRCTSRELPFLVTRSEVHRGQGGGARVLPLVVHQNSAVPSVTSVT